MTAADPTSTPTNGATSNTPDGGYDASMIQVLEGLEAVRKRPSMYIGSTGERGLHHLIWEIVDNAVDEALAGYCDRIVITLQADGGMRVEDNGRGIPTDTAAGQELPAVTLALTVLHAGGKFGGGGYKVSGGLHGVGVSVVNALSSHLKVEVRNRGKLWEQEFSLGDPDYPLREVRDLEEGEGTGTTVTWYASPRHLRVHDVLPRDDQQPLPRDGVPQQGPARSWSTTSGPTPSEVADAVADDTISNEVDQGHAGAIERTGGGLKQVFKYERGLVDYVEHINRTKTAANPTIISFEADTPEDSESHMSLEVAMQWNTGYNESVHTFANTINTHEGGTHEEGFRSALTSLVNGWGEQWGLIKKREDRVSGEDIREGLTAIISIKLGEPQFEGQTKTKLGNTEAKGFVQRIVNDQLGAWLEENPDRGQGDHPQVAGRGDRAQRRAQGARAGPLPQGTARRRRPAGQAVGLPVDQPRGVRGLHRRGRLGGWLGPAGPRPAGPGDPPDPRQDPQRREGAHRQGARQPRGPVDHLRAGHRHPGGVRLRSCATTRSC